MAIPFLRLAVSLRAIILSLTLASAAPALADKSFHLFGGEDAAASLVLRPGLAGLPPERPLAAVARSARPAAAEPDVTSPTDPEASLPPWKPTERNFGLAAAEFALVEFIPWVVPRYVTHADYAYISVATIKNNFRTGFTYDHDAFDTNQSSHPLHGSLYFNAARSNGYTFWESSAFAFFGSFLWETVMEREPPSINDLVNTTLGGITRGEIEHRLAIMIVDNTARGFERFLREAAGLVVDPMGGLTRLVRGDMGRQFQNPPDRLPDRFYLELDAFYQHRNGSAVAGVDTVQGGGAAIFRYGNLFDGNHRAPFDYFDFSAELTAPAGGVGTQIASRGLLTDWVLSDRPGARQRLGLFLHFDYYNNEPLEYGAQAFTLEHLMRVPIGKGVELTTELGVAMLPLAAVQNDYYSNKVGDDGEKLRSYDYSPGGGVQGIVYLRRRGMDLVKLGFTAQWQRTANGVSDNARIESADVEGRLPLSGRVALGGAWAWTSRFSTYTELPSVYVSATSWRVFGAVTFQ